VRRSPDLARDCWGDLRSGCWLGRETGQNTEETGQNTEETGQNTRETGQNARETGQNVGTVMVWALPEKSIPAEWTYWQSISLTNSASIESISSA
jgi:hypothetical protein